MQKRKKSQVLFYTLVINICSIYKGIITGTQTLKSFYFGY